MKIFTKNFIFLIYGFWVLFMLTMAIYGELFSNRIEYGAKSQLWLIISGLPSSLISLLLPVGSLIAVVVAASIGTLQWYFIYRLVKKINKSDT